jgi:trimeric autotransporter adhesin
MTVKVNLSGIDELDFPSGVSSASVLDGVTTINLASSGSGTVTSVGFEGDGTVLSSTESGPVTSAGVLVATLNTQNPNKILAGPTSGSTPATPTFRSLVVADIPSLPYGSGTVTSVATAGIATGGPITTTGTVTVVGSGTTTTAATADTNVASAPSGDVIIADGSGNVEDSGVLLSTLTSKLSNPMTTLGDIIYENATPAPARLAGNVTSTREFLTSLGVSSLATAPTWSALASGDIPNNAANTSGTASNLSGTPALPNGTTATTQSSGDTSTKLATDAFVSTAISALTTGVSAVSNTDGTLTISPTTGAVVASIALGNANTWTGAQTFGLTSYTAAVSNSPTVTFAGSYQSASATFAKDSWTVINTPQAATTNGHDALIFSHSGTTGNVFLQAPNFQFPANGSIDINANGGSVTFTNQYGTSAIGRLTTGAGPGNFGLVGLGTNQTTYVEGVAPTATNHPSVAIAASGQFTATTAITQIGLAIGNYGGSANGTGTDTFTFNPASGSASFVACEIVPTIEGTSSGNTTALLVNPTYTLTGLTGINKLIDLQTSGTSEFSVNTSGAVTTVGGNVTTKQGVAAILKTSFATAQTSSISGASLVTSTPTKGMWRISWVATQTTAGSTGTVLGGTTGFQITFTNANGDTASKTTALSTPITGVGTSTADTISGDVYCYAGASSAITYSFGYTAGSITGGAFDIAVYAEFLG